MQKATQLKYNALRLAIAGHYEADDPRQTFAATPSVAQTLNDKIVERADFLKLINVVPVTEITGEKVMGGITTPITGRTDLTAGDRQPREAQAPDNHPYVLKDTDSDVFMRFATIDAWAKFPQFRALYQRYVQERIALDRIMIGWNGTSAAAETDIDANPLLQDVNIGWLKLCQTNNATRFLTKGDPAATDIQIGIGGHYVNLDALVHDLKQLIHPAHRNAPDLVAIVGQGLLATEKGKLYAAQGLTPTEKQVIENKQVISTYGGLPAIDVPFFPDNGLVITSLSNLSIYWQESSWRRKMEEQENRKRVVDWNSRNEGYVIEDYTKFAAIDASKVVFVEEE